MNCCRQGTKVLRGLTVSTVYRSRRSNTNDKQGILMSNRKIALAFVLATGAVSLGLADLAHAADALEEVTVTATRRNGSKD